MKDKITYKAITGYALAAVSALMSAYHLYVGARGAPEAHWHRSVHITLVLVICVLLNPLRKKGKEDVPTILDLALVGLSLFYGLYFAWTYDELILRVGANTVSDLFVGAILIIIVLEGTRRSIGWVIPGIAVLFLIYSYLGPYSPDFVAHRGFTISQIIIFQSLGLDGILGIPIGVMSTYIVLFILFAVFLEVLQVGEFFTDLAFSITRGMAGGPAKAAVISSALFGMVSGSGVANVATTGTFTIPLMIKAGYRPYFAGAVEAAASNGGQFMPPVMAAAAFIMVEFTGIPYITICKRAAFPAFLYFLAVLAAVHFEAVKRNLRGLENSTAPSIGSLLLRQGYLFLPLVVLVYLLILGSTPMKACFYSIVLMVLLSFFSKKTRPNVSRMFQALVKGAQNSIPIAMTCACAGIIIGCFSQTGLGFKFSELIMRFSAGSLLIALIITMITSLILGMGMPTSGAYIMLAALGAPALIKLGMTTLSAHMFILYFGIMSGITPPVALVSYTAAAIAKADLWRLSLEAIKLALVAFIVPFMFAYNQEIFLIGKPISILGVIFTGSVGAIMLAAALNGWFLTSAGAPERILFFAGGISLIAPGTFTDIIGLALILCGVAIQLIRIRKQPSKKLIRA